jgi:putative pyruvate formate lyase activating enzyme
MTVLDFQESVYDACCLCPRACRIDRNADTRGFCGETSSLRLAWAGLHFGEEPVLVQKNGSGTIFVSGCGARCAFCQNYQISHEGMGRAVSQKEFIDICLALQDLGALNINIVTGSHAVPFLAVALAGAKKAGLAIPVCWNTSAYESPHALKIIAPHIDIWLPDLKTIEPRAGKEIFFAPGYPEAALSAIRFMIEHAPLKYAPVADGARLLGGVIVRHLFLPGRFEDTARVLEWLKVNADSKALISLMTQYTPVNAQKKDAPIEAFENRFVNEQEACDLRELAEAFAFETLFFQELDAGDEWLPDFSRVQPFSNARAQPVWHWKNGFV